jgi:hypothetical protein
MTTFRIQALECFGFEWDSRSAVWENRLSVAAYHRTHGHCDRRMPVLMKFDLLKDFTEVRDKHVGTA